MVLYNIIISKNNIFFDTSNDRYNGLNINLKGQTVKKINARQYRGGLRPASQDAKYLLEPSGIIISIEFLEISVTLNGLKFNEIFVRPDLDDEGYNRFIEESIIVINKMITFLDNYNIKQTGKEVGLVSRLDNLPNNTKGVISSFLTGEKGSIGSQTNKLQQNLGTSLAPRPRKRHTRRRR